MSRRSLVRTGAAAAWTAPLVQVLASAPAQAVGSGVTLAMTGTFAHVAASRTFSFSGTVTNNGTQTTTALAITITLTSNGTTQFTSSTVSSTPTGWSASALSTGGVSGAYTGTWTFTRTGAQLAGAGANLAFAPTFQVPNNTLKSTAGSGTATATATGAASSATGNSYAG